MRSSVRGGRLCSPALLLAVAALLASLTSYPGSVPGDTKLSLYLDPLRLISNSIWTWDQHMFAGWVPHQNVGYLWPTGPFFAIFEAIGIPDWIAHRSWIATLMFLAGWGALRLSRSLGLSLSASFIAALAYQFSPYVLPYISRTSALLLPWSLLPWLILLTMRYARTRRVSDLALFGFVVMSSGGLNATALLMIAPGPLIWLLESYRKNHLSRRELVSISSHLAIVGLGVSTWWLAGLFVQGRYGAAVLSYSEALVSTSTTSTTPEVMRGLGYWLFYDKGPAANLTTASTPYQQSILLLLVSGCLVVLSLVGISKSTQWKRPLSVMLLTGVVLAVGAHPFSSPNFLFRHFAANPKDSVSLALRSSTRAIPLVVLALAIGLGTLWQYRRRSTRSVKEVLRYGFLTAMILGNLPAALNGDLVDRALLRPQEIPGVWQQTARFLDQRFDEGYTGAVLVVPGIESAAYRWGYPVDPIVPALSRKPFLSRDWLPLGSPAVMDLLYAFDDSFQNGTVNPKSIAPVARMLGADTVMFVSSHQYERFDTVRPSRAFDFFDPVPEGLEKLIEFGDPIVNELARVDGLSIWTEEHVVYPDSSLPEIVLYSVEDAQSSTRQFADFVLAATDGTGLVDLASIGTLDGRELSISEASLDSIAYSEATRAASQLIVTDTNRRRAHHWRGSQEIWGATEPEAGLGSVRDDFDSRLPIHPAQSSDSETLIEPSEIEAVATTYGAELRYHPESRPRMAVDGDPSTAWRIDPDRQAVGHVLSLFSTEAVTTLQLLQPHEPVDNRWITHVSIRVDGGHWTSVTLNETSRTLPGSTVELPEVGRVIDIRIDEIAHGAVATLSRGVGFAEVVPRSSTTPEIVRPPIRIGAGEEVAVQYLFTRIRSDPFDRWRDDPERSIIRRIPHGTSIDSNFDAEVRLSSRATDEALMDALGLQSPISEVRLHGSSRWWGPAAFDGDGETAWWGPVTTGVPNRTPERFVISLDRPMEWMEIHQVASPSTSRIMEVSLTFTKMGNVVKTHNVVADEADSSRTIKIVVPATDADTVTFSIDGIDPSHFIDARTGRSLIAPVAITELTSNAWATVELPFAFDTGCRDDLITVDDQPVPVKLVGQTRSALGGAIVPVSFCGTKEVSVPEGALLSVVPGSQSGWDFDRLTFGSLVDPVKPSELIPLEHEASRVTFTATSPGCASRCWIEAPFGSSMGWNARIGDSPVGPPLRSAAGRSLWSLDRIPEPSLLRATWRPQNAMWWGMGITATTLIVLVGLVSREKVRLRARSRMHPRLDRSADESAAMTTGHIDSETTQSVDDEHRYEHRRGKILVRSLLGLLLGLAIVSLPWAILIAVALVFTERVPLMKFATFCISLGFVFVIAQQIRLDASPGFLWPTVFERAHRPMAAVLIVFTMSSFDSRSASTRLTNLLPRGATRRTGIALDSNDDPREASG